jgi:hypothetical protein
VKPRYVYALLDPRYDEVRYIGASTDPWSRVYLPYVENRPWQSHVAQAKRGGSTHKDYWIRGLIEDDRLPLMVILEWGVWTIEQCAEREIWWIAFYREIGARLMNQSGGGEQTPLWQMTDATRELIGQRTKEAMQRPEVRARYEAAMALYREKNPPKPPRTAADRATAKARGRELNRADSTARWANMDPERRAELGRRISEAKRRNRKSDEQRRDDGVRMKVGRRLANARRNGWTLPIVSS